MEDKCGKQFEDTECGWYPKNDEEAKEWADMIQELKIEQWERSLEGAEND